LIPQIDIICEEIDSPSYLKVVESYLVALISLLGEPNWEMSLTLSNNEYIARLNEKYRNIKGPTDVLTFVMDEDSEEMPFQTSHIIPRAVGDIIVSLEKVRENSNELKIPFDEELKRVILHGVLHLKGMTHEGYDWDEGMLKEQETLLKKYRDIRFTEENETFLD
jgi:probable rRNA maturation factor